MWHAAHPHHRTGVGGRRTRPGTTKAQQLICFCLRIDANDATPLTPPRWLGRTLKYQQGLWITADENLIAVRIKEEMTIEDNATTAGQRKIWPTRGAQIPFRNKDPVFIGSIKSRMSYNYCTLIPCRSGPGPAQIMDRKRKQS